MALEVTKLLTYEAYLKTPETKQRYEIVDGELIMSPSPLPLHQWIVANLFRLLDAYVREHQLGVVLFAPLDIVIRQTPLRTRQPDVLFLSAVHSGIVGRDQLQGLPLLPHAPDLVVEILSPSNARRDLRKKIEDYRIIGVRECWVVRLEAQTVEVLRLSATTEETVDIFSMGMTVRSEVLDEYTVAVEDIFA